MIRSDWTPEETEALKLHRANGLSAGQIAKLLPGRSRNSVLGRVMRLGLDKLDPHKCQYPQGAQSKKKRYPPKPKSPPAMPAKAAAEESAPEAARDENGDRITVLNAKDSHCRYPFGEVGHDSFHFCGNQVERGSWCCYHRLRCFTPGTEYRGRPA